MPSKGPASGIPAGGKSKHGEDCECPRCRGFAKGNDLSLIHGGTVRTLARFEERAEELAEEIRLLVPAYRAADEYTIKLFAVQLARIEKIDEAITQLETQDQPDLAVVMRAEDHLRKFIVSTGRYIDMLGLAPSARARLGVDIAVTRRQESLADLHQRAARERHETIDQPAEDAELAEA